MRVASSLLTAAAFTAIFIAVAFLSAVATKAVHEQIFTASAKNGR